MEENYTREKIEKQENAGVKEHLHNKKMFCVIGIIMAAFLIGIYIFMPKNGELTNQLILGQKYIEDCDYEQAIVAFNRAIEIDEKCVEAYLGLAETYIRMGEFDKALEIVEKGYELTEDAGLQEYIDMIQSENISQPDGKGAKIMPKNEELTNQLNLGQKYIEDCDYEQAIVAFNHAIEIDERCVEAYLGLTETYIRMGEFDKALEIAEKGYEMTGDAGLQEYIDMLQSGNISRSDGKWMKMIGYDEEGALVYSHVATYNKEGRQDSVSHYDSADNLVRKIDLTYDEDGQQLVNYSMSTVNGILEKMENTYENGVLKSEKDEYGDWRVYDYEENGRRVKVTSGYGQNVGAEEEITGYEVCDVDEEGHYIRQEFYDASFNLTWYSIFEYEDGKIKWNKSYDEDGNLDEYRTWEYDENGKMSGSYYYDADGNLTRQEKYE